MPFERAIRLFFVVAAVAASTPASAHARDGLIWLDMCDAAHPGRKIPLPVERDGRGSGQACHAACAVFSDRRARR
jgi:hypothetical protein